jgi:WD40 repeat protein
VIFTDGVSIHQHNGKFIQLFMTGPNPNGICSMATKKNAILALPDTEKGSIQIIDINTMEYTTFQAHDNVIELIALTEDGKFVATASSKGTLIRVIELTTGNMIREFRRGSHPCTVYSIAFSQDKKFLASSGSSGTVHLYDLESESLVTDILDSLNISFAHSSAKFHGVIGKSVLVFPASLDYQRMLTVITSAGCMLQLNFITKKNLFCEEKLQFLK